MDKEKRQEIKKRGQELLQKFLATFPDVYSKNVEIRDAGCAIFTDGKFWRLRSPKWLKDENPEYRKWAWTDYETRSYMKKYHSIPFCAVNFKAEEVEKVLGITGITREEANAIMQNSPRCHQRKYANQFIQNHLKELALAPFQMEEIFGISKRERKRWENVGRLKVVGYCEVVLGGFDYKTPARRYASCYDRFQAKELTPEKIAKWREQDKNGETAKLEKRLEAKRKKARGNSAFGPEIPDDEIPF